MFMSSMMFIRDLGDQVLIPHWAHCGYGIFSDYFLFCLHFSEHAQWGLPVMSDILVKIFVDISCNICGLLLL